MFSNIRTQDLAAFYAGCPSWRNLPIVGKCVVAKYKNLWINGLAVTEKARDETLARNLTRNIRISKFQYFLTLVQSSWGQLICFFIFTCTQCMYNWRTLFQYFYSSKRYLIPSLSFVRHASTVCFVSRLHPQTRGKWLGTTSANGILLPYIAVLNDELAKYSAVLVRKEQS